MAHCLMVGKQFRVIRELGYTGWTREISDDIEKQVGYLNKWRGRVS